jgi:hypothetical protein
MSYFGGDGYFGGGPRLSGRARRAGFGQATPSDIAAQAGGQAVAYAQQGQAQVAALQAQGQQLYTQANALAAAGTGAANGNLQSVLLTATLAANNVPAGQAKAVLQGAIAAAGGAIATAGILTTATAWLVANGFLVAGSAVAASIPIVGTMVVVMVLAMQLAISAWGATSPTTTTPGVVTALLAVPIPSGGTTATPQPGEPPANDPTKTVASTCITSDGSGTVGGALAAWRDFLDYAANPSNAQPSTMRGNTPYPAPGQPSASGFSLGCATWQACATMQEACVGFAIGGEPNALAAAALAVRWVPLGDPWVAPYQDTFAQMPGAPGDVAYTLENKLIALAYATSQWPQGLADQQALQYLTSLAWVWSNYPGAPATPLPGWIAYKLGHLRMLVAQDGNIVAPAGGAPATVAISCAATAALIAAPALYALAMRRPVLSGYKTLYALARTKLRGL